MEAFDRSPEAVRSRICDAFLVAFAVAAIPILALTLYRIPEIGWQPLMAVHIAIVALLWLVVLIRQRLPYVVRAGYLVVLFLVVGLGGIWSFGLVAGGASWLIVAPIMSTAFFGRRSGLLTLALIGVLAAAVGVVTVVDQRLPAFDLAAYLTSPRVWTISVASWLFLGGSLTIAFGVFNRSLINALETSRRHAKSMRESESDLRNILANMVDTFYRADRDGRIVMVSPSVEDLIGLAPEDLVGRKLIDFYVDKDRRAEFLEALDKGGGRVTDFEAEVFRKNGDKVVVATNARYWRDDDGNVLGVEGLIRDVTAQRRAEEVLRRSQKMEAVGQLTGGIAHDYNNMLGVIMGNIELVQWSGQLDDKGLERLDRALEAARRNAALTNKLVGLSRRQVHGSQPTAVNDLILKLEEVIAKSLTVSIRVEHDLAGDLWLADIDPAEFEDMLLNLSLNARDAMPDGGTITFETANKVLDDDDVRINPDSRAGEYVMVSVSDTGCGMTDEVRERAFEPFFSTKDTGKGTGLGLSMVYAFVQRSQGHIKIYSEPGRGTTFHIFLPRSSVTATPAQDGDAERPVAGGTETILVVDDEPALVDIATVILDEFGYKVVGAHSADQAIEVLSTMPEVDLLFSDIVMPGKMDGYQLAQAARARRPDLRILLTSGFAKNRDQTAIGDDPALARLAAGRLKKPYTRSELAEAVRRVLDETDAEG